MSFNHVLCSCGRSKPTRIAAVVLLFDPDVSLAVSMLETLCSHILGIKISNATVNMEFNMRNFFELKDICEI